MPARHHDPEKIYLRPSSAGADSEQKDIPKYFLPAFVKRCINAYGLMLRSGTA
jgi:hypothetical protein